MTSGHHLLYGRLAWLFPILSPVKTYVRETRYFARLIRSRSRIRVRTLLHLGCGAGHNDSVFKKMFAVTGVDLSRSMLRRARELNPEVSYRQADLRSVRLAEKFDAVAAVDSLAYMLTAGDLRAAFRTAYAHLRPGGVFFFILDMTRESFRQDRTSVWTTRAPGVTATFFEHCHDPDRNDTTYEAVFVSLIRRGKALKAYADFHRCGLFRRSLVLKLLREAGFRAKHISYKPAPEAVEPGGSGLQSRYPLFLALKPARG